MSRVAAASGVDREDPARRMPRGHRGLRVRRPIARRLAITFVVSTAALLLAVTVTTYLLVGRQLAQQLDDRLAEQATVLAADVDPGDERDPAALAADLFGGEVPPLDVQLLGPAGNVIASTGAVRGGGPLIGPQAVATVREGQVATGTLTVEGEPIRVHARPVPDTELVIVSASDLEPIRGPQRTLLGVLVPVGLLGLAGLALLGWVTTRRALHPLADIAGRAENIDADELDARLPVLRSEDEVERLATTINGMLDRLAGAIQRERRFTADASHELRTPLAIIRGELELAAGSASGRARERVESALEEIDRLTAMIEDLLVLARADADQVRAVVEIPLDRLVARVAARFAELAATAEVEIRATGEGMVVGDDAALDRALTNLVDNAVRHTPPSGTVTVAARVDRGEARITVEDTGPGVAPAALPRLFDRFSRTDDARTRGGAGLGLAIVEAVMVAHGGSVQASRGSAGGLRIECRLPVSAATPHGPGPVV